MIVKIKINLLFFLLFNIVFSGCFIFKEKYPVNINGLTYRNKLALNKQFKIDGLYYCDGSKQKIYTSFPMLCFYKDGTIYESNIDSSELNKIQSSFIISEDYRNTPWFWGVYIVENDTIKIQKVNSHRGIFDKFKVEEKWATIINDTTIHFFKYISTYKSEQKLDLIYHFKKCINKPDSTNILMKYD